MTVEELKELNKVKIQVSKQAGDIEKAQTHEKIAELLERNPALFFQIDMESALRILVQILPDEQVKEAYESLISPDVFGELRGKYKI